MERAFFVVRMLLFGEYTWKISDTMEVILCTCWLLKKY
jgi:hypothetical protein